MSDETQRNPMTGDKLRNQIRNLVLDWVLLRTALPIPPRIEGRKLARLEYGHPAEWASDTASHITDILASWHDLLAEHRNETPPPTGAEQVRISAAWKYLDPRCDQLVDMVEPEAFAEINDTHWRIKRTLGYTNPPQTLPMPCPNGDCELLTLQRIVLVGRDFVECASCGYSIKEQHYPLLIRMALDTLIDAN